MRNRGVSEEDALSMADGKIFIGKQAIEAGLVDGVSAFDDLINSIYAGVAGKPTAKEESIVDLKELKEKHADIYAAVVAEGKLLGIAEAETAGAAKIAEARTAGAVAERQRIADVRAQSIAGHEALIEGFVMDGHTSGPEAAVAVLAAEKAVRKGKKEEFDADGKPLVTNAPTGDKINPPAAGETAKSMSEAGDKLDAFAKAIQKEKNCAYSEAFKQARVAHPALAKAYDRKEE
jgi:hypothetical protein